MIYIGDDADIDGQIDSDSLQPHGFFCRDRRGPRIPSRHTAGRMRQRPGERRFRVRLKRHVHCFLFSCDVLQHFAIISYLQYGTTTILRSHATRQFRWLWVRVVAAAAAQYRRSCRAAPQRRGVEV